MARRRRRKKEAAPSKVVWLEDNSPAGQGTTPSGARKGPKKARVGRLRWTCLTCLEAGTQGTRVARRACSRHGTGDHVRRIRAATG